MSGRWDALNARARGLSTRLLDRGRLATLAGSADVPALAARLRDAGLPVAEGATTPDEIDVALRRHAGQALRVLARWTAHRPAMATLIFDAEDRRSVRAMLRGAVGRLPAAARLAGLIPTPGLPLRALEALSRAASPDRVPAMLLAWRHPFGPPLLPVVRGPEPDLFAAEQALNRAVAARAVAAGRRGGRALAAFVRDEIDVANAAVAVTLAGHREDADPKDVFLPGGARLTFADFVAAASAPDPAAAADRVARCFRGTALAAAFSLNGEDPGTLEDAVLRARIAALRRRARREPLGPAPALTFALRLRAEHVDLQRLVWGVALQAPAPRLARTLVTG